MTATVAAAQTATQSTTSVLVVDDHTTFSDLLAMALEN